MRNLPPPDPGIPDLRSPSRFLLRVLRLQAGTVACGVSFGVAWMAAQAFVPFAVGRAVDEGLGAGGRVEDLSRLLLWCGVITALGVVQALAGLGRHRFAVTSWLVAYLRTVQWLTATTARLGASLASQTSSGEVVSVGATDTVAVARALDILARGIGSLVAFVLVAALLLHASPTLGLVVVVGVPVFALGLGPLLRPLHRRQAAQREVSGVLTGLGADTVAGLRVLRGVGGEQAFLDRYRVRSHAVRVAGEQVARTQALLDSAQVLLPGAVVVVVTWLGARAAVSGAISPGELVAFYGYAAFLLTPLRNLVELADKVTRAHVAARRLIAVLALEPLLSEPASPVPAPAPGGALLDPVTGFLASPGLLTAVVCEDTTAGADLADRLGRYPGPGAVGVLGGVGLDQLPLALVRARVLVADATPAVFSGSVRAALDPTGRHPDPVLLAAVEAAAAADVLDGLPDGLDTVLTERARSLSGGQRQRLVLARALVADPEVLVLVEPTSAVDAHTEARIAARLGAARAGRTTVLLTASPLLLDRADTVALVVDGTVVTTGRHRALLTDPRYRAVVTREVTV